MTEPNKYQIWNWKKALNFFKKIVSAPEKIDSIQDGLVKLNSKLKLTESFFVKEKNRMSQFTSLADDGSIHIDFWENGICWHSQTLPNNQKVSLASYLWNELRFNSDEIERQIPEIQFPLKRKKIEISNVEYIKWHWQNLLDNTKYISQNEIELVKLLSKDSTTNKLMTFHQLWDLGLSRYIGEQGDELNNDLLRASITDDTIFVRTEEQAIQHNWRGTQDCLGQGNPKEAYKIILDNLPFDIDWAEYQTLEQYETRIEQNRLN